MAHTTGGHHDRRRRLLVGASAAAVGVVLLTACGGDPTAADDTATATPAPPFTPPPTPTREGDADAAIEATFGTVVAGLDRYYGHASSHGGHAGWSEELVTEWPLQAQAGVEVTSWVEGFGNSEVEQVGESVIATHDVIDVTLPAPDGSRIATSRACLDKGEITFVTYDGRPATPPSEAPRFQTWDMTWILLPDSGEWQMDTIALTLDEPC